jgi:ornithine decarboxylase
MSINKIAKLLISKHKINDSFYIVSMNKLNQKIKNWNKYFPNIQPYYAIKSNPDINIIKYMINKGFGFDCASKNEISTIINAGSNKIIFSHPVKKVNDLLFANKYNINNTTFDSLCEIHKINKYAPNMNCLIRLKIDNNNAKVKLGLKYGVEENEYKQLIDECKKLNIKLNGVSFHVGSDNHDPYIFKNALDYSNKVIEYAKINNYNIDIIDIGGGFNKNNYIETSKVINKEIKNKKNKNIKYIAEPGRYFSEEIFTFFTPIVGIKEKNNYYNYWVTDSLYGSFNCIMYDHSNPSFEVIRHPMLDNNYSDKIYKSTIYGLTCDSLDVIKSNTELPKLRLNDFLMVKNFGAYTLSGSCDFNGFPLSKPLIFYI